MAEIWEANNEILITLRELVASYHPHLATVVDDIAVVFKEKASKRGGVIIPGKAKKASPLLGVLGKKNYVFVFEIGWDEWGTYNDKQRLALLDHLLCGCRMKSDEDGEGLKYFIAAPDFSFYKDEIQRHGIWQNIETQDVAGDLAATAIEETFGVAP